MTSLVAIADQANRDPNARVIVVVVLALMGAILVLFIVYVVRSLKPKPFPLLPGEQLDRDVPANRAARFGNAGGVLRLTNQRLIFLPHAMNFGDLKPLVLHWNQVGRAFYGFAGKETGLKNAVAALHQQLGGGNLVVEHVGGTDSFVVHASPELLHRIDWYIQNARMIAYRAQ